MYSLGRLIGYSESNGYPTEDTSLPAYVWAETLDTSLYENITSVTNFHLYGNDGNRDYKFIRAQMMVLVYITGFSNLSTEEKKIASKYFTVSKANRDSVNTLTEQIRNGMEFNTNSVAARRKRFYWAVSECYNRFTTDQANTLINEAEGLISRYITYGREGTLEGDPEGLFDYIEARAGTSYATTGLSAKNWTPLGVNSMPELITHIMDILKNGNYSVLI